MSREQIEEMNKSISEYHELWKHGDGDWRKGLAEYLYNAGYRKQSKSVANKRTNHGEWEVKIFGLTNEKKVTCSCCGYGEYRGPCWDISWGMYKFCPNCGAKMKGGAE